MLNDLKREKLVSPGIKVSDKGSLIGSVIVGRESGLDL